MKGLIISGSRNVFVVKPEIPHNTNFIECRIKGKVLKEDEDFYNPLAPGDIVEFEIGTGLIVSLEKRRNIFMRFNIKGNVPQILAANIDLAFCITSPASPPFRPRFIDRFLLQAEVCGIPPVILCNKNDLLCENSNDYAVIQERLKNYREIGYKSIFTSVRTGEGLEDLRNMLKTKTSVFCGQSGVGKSSLLNALLPDACMKVGGMNKKWDRGNHTTVMSHLFESKTDKFMLIDTPGIRNFSIAGVTACNVINYMPDILKAASNCSFGASCGHRKEAGCGVLEAVNAGKIHPERYENFIKIFDELKLLSPG
jgi:ribosome biogenesis GTPase